MNGWDLIGAASQDAINAQLAKLGPISANFTNTLDVLGGLKIPVNVNVKFSAPQIRVRELSGRLVDVMLPVSGSVGAAVSGAGSTTVTLPPGEVLTVTTSLKYLEADLNPHPGAGQTAYDLIIDFENQNLIANITSNMDPATLAFLLSNLTTAVQAKIGNGKQFKVASFTLTSAEVAEFKPVIPYVADFSFVQNATNPGRSNLLVLMQSVTQGKGSVTFDAPLLADGQDFAVIVSNKILLQYYVMPAVIQQVEAQAKNKAAVPNQIATHAIAGQQDMYEIQNNSSIAIAADHNPWISSVTAFIDQTQQALQLFMDGQANVTFLNFHVDAWDRSWQQFRIDAQNNISLVQINEQHNTSTSLDWWKWLLGVLTGPISLIFEGIIFAVVKGHAPNLGGTLVDAHALVTWPNQKKVILKSITTPGHVVMTLQVQF